MDLFQDLGKVALGSRIRRLGDIFSGEAARIYSLYQVDIKPKWFPVFHLLSQSESSSITQMARLIGCSHPVVSQVVKEMGKAGLVRTTPDQSDARINAVSLTRAGRALIPAMQVQMEDVQHAVEQLLREMQHDFWKALGELEFLLDQRGLYERVLETKKQRESGSVEIIDYSPEYHEDFRRLNHEWIETYFQMEAADRDLLDDPEGRILKPGGWILLARYQGDMVGTCALLKSDGQVFELVKMAVTPSAQGKNIGWLLGRAALAKARALGARKLRLESNTSLKPALNLYQKLGFKKVKGRPSPYERCNIQMELELESQK